MRTCAQIQANMNKHANSPKNMQTHTKEESTGRIAKRADLCGMSQVSPYESITAAQTLQDRDHWHHDC